MFSNPEIALQIIIFLLAVSFVISSLVFLISKKLFLSLVVMSVLSNAVWLFDIFTGSEIYYSYDIMFLFYFSLYIWPLINIFLVIKYLKKRKLS